MSEAGVRGIILAHGSMATGLVDAVRQIAGIEEGVLTPLSNKGLSPEAIGDLVRSHVHGPTILFTDLQSGSCGFAARRYCHDLADFVVISGVSLPALLEFVMNRQLALDELAARVVERARNAIISSPGDAAVNEHRAVSR